MIKEICSYGEINSVLLFKRPLGSALPIADQSRDFGNDIYSLVTVYTTFPDISLSWLVEHEIELLKPVKMWMF